VDRTDAAGQPGGEHVILLHPDRALWALTNLTGLEVARLCDGTRTIAQVAEELAGTYGLESGASILEDVQAFLLEAVAVRLLEEGPDGRPTTLAGEEGPSQDEPTFTRNLSLYLTEQCNLRCKHCFVVEGKMSDDQLGTDDVKRLIDEHTSRVGRTSVTFSGGEVTLHPDWLFLVEHAAARATRVVVCTNGLLLNEDEAIRLGKLPVEVQVSLDGPDPAMHDFIRGKGSFEKTWGALELLARHLPKAVCVSCTLTRAVVDDVRRLIERIDTLGGIGLLRFLPLLKQKAALTHWDEIAPTREQMIAVYRFVMDEVPTMRRSSSTQVRGNFPGFVPNLSPSGNWCPLGRMTLVDAKGKAYNCPSMNTAEYLVGDVRTSSLAEIENGAANQRLRERMLARRYAIPACQQCAWRNFCQGGCTALMYLKTNDHFLTDEFCEFRRELYRKEALRRAGVA